MLSSELTGSMADIESDCELLDCGELGDGGGVCCCCEAFCEMRVADAGVLN